MERWHFFHFQKQRIEPMNLFQTDGTKPRPLAGIRIVECGVWHAGPGGSAILADLGAEVIKVESLDGEPERTLGRSLGTTSFEGVEKDDWTLLFEISNRNKKGICLDIASPEGKEVLHRLVATADVFTTNLRKTTVPQLGIDYETLKAVNPKIIHASLSGFGSQGKMSEAGGFDPMAQAMSGMVFLAGHDEPTVLQTFIVDQLASITLSQAIQTALFVRERHGYGQALHVSLYSAAIWLLYCNITATSVMGYNGHASWDRFANPPLRNTYKCGDGKWMMCTNNPEHKYWDRFCTVTGLTEEMQDPRFATATARKENARELVMFLDLAMLAKSREEWLALLNGAGLLFCPVQTIDEVLKDPQALANNYIIDVDHAVMGKVRLPGYPVQFSANDTCVGPAPERGEHTDTVLAELGYSLEAVDRLRVKAVAK
jgi:crotonobetainyl-CoA:carnitine CoA-transferase CaiB-like acyl-CoA transferase